MEHNLARLTVDLPLEIHKVIKIQAALNDLSIKDFVIEAITEKIGEGRELNDKTIAAIKKSIKNQSKLKSFCDTKSAMNYLLSNKKPTKKPTKKLNEKN